jgi:hypothetical protein
MVLSYSFNRSKNSFATYLYRMRGKTKTSDFLVNSVWLHSCVGGIKPTGCAASGRNALNNKYATIRIDKVSCKSEKNKSSKQYK